MEYKIVGRGLWEPKLVPVSYNINNMINEKPNLDYYESFYLFNETHKKQFDETQSIANLTGAVTKRLIFDFDLPKEEMKRLEQEDPVTAREKALELARQDTIETLQRLHENDIDIYKSNVYYSGNKGFHIEIDTNDVFNRAQFTKTIKSFAGDLKTFDPKIVNENRVFRVPLTKNLGTGGYKIPLTLDELNGLSLEDIQKKSKNANLKELTTLIKKETVVIPKKVYSLPELKKKLEPKVIKVEQETLLEKPNMQNRPKHMTPARFALQQGFFEAGERNEAYMILAATYKAQGFDAEHTWRLLKGVNELQSRRTGQEEKDPNELWINIISVVYGVNWRGAIFSETENELLVKTIQKYNLQVENTKETKISTIDDVSVRFTSFAENIDKNRVMTGIPWIDKDVVLTTGMLVGWLGAPSSGKTSHVLNIVEHNAMNGNHCFFGSHDMYDSLLYTRLLQKYANYDMMTILDMMKKRNPTKELRQAFETVKNNFANVGFNFQSGPTVEDIGRSIDEYQDKKGEKLRLVVVDYLEKITGQYSDATANSGFNAARLADLAKDKEVCLILLLQPQKSAGDPSDPLLSYRKIKGASVIEQDARVILTNWRPGFDPNNDNKDDNYATIAVVKNNMGPVGKYEFAWDGISGRIREMTLDEQEQQKRVVTAATERKKKVEDSF